VKIHSKVRFKSMKFPQLFEISARDFLTKEVKSVLAVLAIEIITILTVITATSAALSNGRIGYCRL